MINASATPIDLPWRLEEIGFAEVDAACVRGDERLFFLLTSASFIETGSDVYTRNLLTYYGDDPQTSTWLVNRWQHEELQHGRALRAYLEAVWPEFDWESGFNRFFQDYQAICALDQFEPTPTLELAARCVVETVTSAFYRMLYEAAPEPVLRRILNNIRSDEVRHFKYFYRFFLARRERERNGRMQVAGALLRRLLEAMKDDGYCAFRHAYAARYPRRPITPGTYRAFRRDVDALARRHFPYRMAAEMLLTPLDLPGSVRTPVARAVVAGFRTFGF